MEIVLRSNVTVIDPPGWLLHWMKITYTMENPAYFDRKSRNIPVYGTSKRLCLFTFDNTTNTLSFGRGMLYDVINKIKDRGVDYTFIDDRSQGHYLDAEFTGTLEDFQVPAVDALTKRDFGILCSPAGSGKTVMGLNLIAKLKTTTLWLTHTTDLLRQTKLRAEQFLKGIGRVGTLHGHSKELGSGGVIVANVKTVKNFDEEFFTTLCQLIGMIIVDEAHHTPSDVFSDILVRAPVKRVYGLTATPDRADGLSFLMESTIGKVAYTVNRDVLYKTNKLVIPELKVIDTDFMYKGTDSDEESSVDAGGEEFDYHRLLDELVEDEARRKLILDNISHMHSKSGMYQIILADRKEYLFKLAEELPKLLTRPAVIEVVHSGLSKKVRIDIMERLCNKQIDVIFATQLAREGLDVPHLNVMHLVWPRKGDSKRTREDGSVEFRQGCALEQEIGRIMRPVPGESKKAYLFDYVDADNGVLVRQYYTRRKVYERLKIKAPRRAVRQKKLVEVEKFLRSTNIF